MASTLLGGRTADQPSTATPPPPYEPDRGAREPRGPTSPLRLGLPRPWRTRVAAFDSTVDRAFDRLRGNSTADRFFYAASELGEFALIWHILAAAQGLRPDREPTEAARLSAILGMESLIVNGLIKSVFRRQRPAWDQPRTYLIRKPRTSSFPSGHASSAFTAAGVMSEEDALWPLYYAAAVVVASSRVYVKIHHASDVVAGAATGFLLARLARRLTGPIRNKAVRAGGS